MVPRSPTMSRNVPTATALKGATVAFFVVSTVRNADLVAPDVPRFLQRLAPVWVDVRPLEQRSMGTRVYYKCCWIQGQSLGQVRRPPPAPTTGETDDISPHRLLLPDGLLLPYADAPTSEASPACSGEQTGNDDSCRFKSVVCTATLRVDEILDSLRHDDVDHEDVCKCHRQFDKEAALTS